MDVYEYDEMAEASRKGWDTAPVLIEGASDRYDDGAWEFDTSNVEGASVTLSSAEYDAAVRIVNEPENADCERGADCVVQRPTLIVGGEVRKTSGDFIGFHLAEDPDTGIERMVFKAFYVTDDGIAICEACADEMPSNSSTETSATPADFLMGDSRGPDAQAALGAALARGAEVVVLDAKDKS